MCQKPLLLSSLSTKKILLQEDQKGQHPVCTLQPTLKTQGLTPFQPGFSAPRAHEVVVFQPEAARSQEHSGQVITFGQTQNLRLEIEVSWRRSSSKTTYQTQP